MHANMKCGVNWKELSVLRNYRNYRARAAINFEKTLLLVGQKTMGFLLDKELCAYL